MTEGKWGGVFAPLLFVCKGTECGIALGLTRKGRRMAQDKAGDILARLEGIAPGHGVDIVDVEVVGATKAPTVRVRIDWADEGRGPIGLDDVAAQTSWVSVALDELDPFTGSFTLEVSSPGLSRPIRRERDFERFAGENVALATTATEGRRKFSGKLLGMREGSVAIATDEGEVAIPLAEVKRCTIKPTFDFSEKKSSK